MWIEKTRLLLRQLSLVLVLTEACALTAAAQATVMYDNQPQRSGTLTVRVTAKGQLKPGEAIVRLSSGSDKLLPDSVSNNDYVFRNMNGGVFYVTVSAEGYAAVRDTVCPHSGRNTLKEICLTERVIQLKTVTVKGKQPAIVYRGDTIQLNPGAVNIAPGDAVREMLEQMPGVDIKENSVQVQGKNIERTYVDGKRLFGRDPMTAIDHVAADDVVNIKMYEEDNKDEQRRGERKRKRWVFNVITKSKLVNSYDGSVMAGAGPTLGSDLSNHKVRGLAGGLFNFFSEDLLFTSDLMHNNVNMPTNSTRLLFQPKSVNPVYGENTHAGFNISKEQPDVKYGLSRIDIKYGYSRKATESNSTVSRSYVPNEAYDSRTYTQNSTSRIQDNIHNIALATDITMMKAGNIFLNIDGNVGNSHSNTLQATEDVVNLTSFTDNNVTTQDRNKSNAFTGSVKYILPLPDENHRVVVDAGVSHDYQKTSRNNVSDGYVDENLQIRSYRKNNSWHLGTTFETLLGKKTVKSGASLRTGYNFKQTNGQRNSDGTDAVTGETDPLNTYGYRSRLDKHAPFLSLHGRYKNDEAYLEFTWNHNSLTDNKTDVANGQSRYTFCNWDINSSIGKVMFCHKLSSRIAYKLSATLPTTDQLRNIVDNTNPMFVQSGNPALKQTLTHNITLDNSLRLNNRGMLLNVGLSYLTDNDHIAARTWYFDTDTYMPDFSYQAKANTTLASYDNAGRAWSAGVNTTLEIPLSSLRSSVRIAVSDLYNDTPYYFNSELDKVKVNNFNGAVLMKTSLMPRTFLMVEPTFSYRTVRQAGDGFNNDILNAGLKVDLQVKRFMKYFFFNAVYRLNYSDYKTLRHVETENMLNLYCGAHVFKGRGEVNLTVRDLLNSYDAHRLTVTDNYTQWSNTVNYGRMICLNFVWKFRKVKSPRMVIGQGVTW